MNQNETVEIKTAAEVEASALNNFVSLTITDDTDLTQQAEMFGDGEAGYFMQQYSLYADDQETGVTMLITGNLGQDNTSRTFTANGDDFDNPKDAFIAAGHKWAKVS